MLTESDCLMTIMKCWIRRFNSYLLVMLLVWGAHGRAADVSSAKSARRAPAAKTNAPAVKTEAEKKPDRKTRRELSTFKVHVEIHDDGTQWCRKIQVDRQLPLMITVDRTPVLEEEHVERAEVIDVMGGYALRIKLNERGTLRLDVTTTSYRGQRLAIFSNFGQDRWLGAPMITQRIRDGVLTFTPDATREEAVRMANGLNNQAAKLKKKSSF